MESLSLYLHIPFCQRRCGYCDFNTYAGLDRLIPAYVNALAGEINFFGEQNADLGGAIVHTIYFGGGTPSLLSEGQLGWLIGTIRDAFEVTEDCEVTIEANPGTVGEHFLERIRAHGVNRISLGVQSAIPSELIVLDRQHGFHEARAAVAGCRAAGFDNISLDLIYGIPGQTVETWNKSLDEVVSLSPEHLSLYSLTVEPGTPLKEKIAAGHLHAPDEDLGADMYDLAEEKLAGLGYRHYEISNWGLSRDGETLVSRHNRQYWRNLPYLGMGAGAHGFFAGVRYENAGGVADYIRRMRPGNTKMISPVVVQEEKINRQREMDETMMMGLRLLDEGVSARQFEARFGVPMTEVYQIEIDKFISLDLLEWDFGENQVLRLTRRGHLLGNQVFSAFV